MTMTLELQSREVTRGLKMTMFPGIVGKPKFQTTGGFHFCVGNTQFPAAISNSRLSLFFLHEELQ